MNGRPVVVVTGASAGVGRATARMYGERGAAVAWLAGRTTGLAGAAEDVREAGGQALELPTDVADHEQVYAAAGRVEDELGPIDVWVNVAFSGVFAPATEITAEEFKRTTEGQLPGVRLRHQGRARPHVAAQPRRDRAGRFGAGLPRHSAAERLLRVQARHPGLHRVGPGRAVAPEDRRAHHDGAAAGAEHPAVRLGALAAAGPPAAGAADLLARGGRPRHRLRG